MGNIKKLAGQTLWYGLSSMGARFLNYLLTPYFTLKLSGAGYGEMSILYAAIPFLNVIFTYGMETSFFRFAQKKELGDQVKDTSMISLLCSTILFTALLLLFHDQLARTTGAEKHPDYIIWVALIIAFDALSAIPFAMLREEGRPVKFASVRIGGVLVNIAAVLFFMSLLPALKAKGSSSALLLLYREDYQVGYILIANFLQSIFTLLFLSKEILSFRWKFNGTLWKEMMIYSLPLTIVGFGGVINETMDRLMLAWLLPYSSERRIKIEIGTYSAVYKLAILITLFIQAFRMGAEPFFFKQSTSEDAPHTYARVMKFFVITVCGMFLVVSLYLDIWKHFIQNPEFWKGLKAVPLLLFANIFLGIYYNLSIWYKISGRTRAGATITLVGSAITILVNFIFIPYYSYMASTMATFLCYGTMMVISYTWGQKVYPIPYAVKKLCAYMAIVALLYILHHFLTGLWTNSVFSLSLATIFLGCYSLLILKVERKEFRKLPVVGKYL